MPTVNIYEGPAKYAAIMAATPRHILLLYAGHMCLAEIYNGGFLQFFLNNTGIVAPEAVEAFRTMGMVNLASVVEKVASNLGPPYPRDRNDRWDALLKASGKSTRDLERIFKRQEHQYLAFVEATEPLGFDVLSQQVYKLAESENGGFQEAATNYARKVAIQ
jgi:uncharacterized protein DUF4375